MSAGRPERDFGAVARWVALATALVLLVFVVLGLARLSSGTADMSEDSVRRAIRSCVLQCYALEGAYPPSLEYLEENYGLILDKVRYAYLYETPGSNLYPIVEVQRR